MDVGSLCSFLAICILPYMFIIFSPLHIYTSSSYKQISVDARSSDLPVHRRVTLLVWVALTFVIVPMIFKAVFYGKVHCWRAEQKPNREVRFLKGGREGRREGVYLGEHSIDHSIGLTRKQEK